MKNINNTLRANNRSLKLILCLSAILTIGNIQAQTDYSGTWYISNGNNSGYYLVPSIGGYYSEDDSKPYITTYKTNKDYNSIWRLVKVTVGSENYYRIVHNNTGLYLTFNDIADASNPDRLRLHLEHFNTPSDATLFIIAQNSSNDGIGFRPKDYDGGTNKRFWFDVSSSNKDNYWNNNSEGCLGLWESLTDVNKAAKFYLYSATPTCAAPIITHEAGSFSISYPFSGDGVSIHYTTNGDAPTATSPTYSSAIPEAGVTMVRAIAVKSGYDNSQEARLYNPNQSFLIKTTETTNQSYYIVPPLDETSTTDLYATTSNVPDEKMEWMFKPAVLSGGVQYYYLYNPSTGKYMYCHVERNSGNAILMKPLNEAGTTPARYRFRLWEEEDYTLIISKQYVQYVPSSSSNNMLFKSKGDNSTDYLGLYADNANGRSRWKIIAKPTDPRTLSTITFASDNTNTTYWKIQNVNDKNYYVCPPTATATNQRATAATSGANMEWLLEKATDPDTWVTYYHIRNGETGDYLYFRGNPNEKNVFFTASSATPSADDGFKFIVVRTANQDATNSYNIIPKQLKNSPNQSNISLNRDGSALQTKNSRDNKNSQWNFVQVTNKVSPPVFTQSTYNGEVNLSCITAGATIYYTTDGTDPSSSSTRQAYTTAITPTSSALNTFKACAVKDGITSTVVTKTVDLSTRTKGYYVLHKNGTGYLKVAGGSVNLSNDGNFQSGNLFDKGNCIWVLTEEGYLQNEYYFLNVANNRTLYLSVEPTTRWMTEDVSGTQKKILYINDGIRNLYLGYDSGVKLSAAAANAYRTCTVNIQEVSWSGPNSDALTLLSPQLITYLHYYFTQRIQYSFVNDGGSTVSHNSHDRRVYTTLEYVSSSTADKGTTWDIDNNIIYNKQTVGNISVTATCNMLPADPIARSTHATAVAKAITFTLQPPAITPDNVHYLLFNFSNANYRFPFDNNIPEGQPVNPYCSKARLTWPENTEISWTIECDEQGYVMFKNIKTGHYIYYDANDYTNSDYGTVVIGGTTPTDTRYKFRLYKYKTDDTWGDNMVSIFPYEKQFSVYKSDSYSNDIYSAIGPDDISRVITLFKPNDRKWKFYPYEVEDSYRLQDNFTINIPDAIKTSATVATVKQPGTYEFNAQSYHWLSIKDAPKNNKELEIYNTGSYTDIVYDWTITGLDAYTSSPFLSSSGESKSYFSAVIESLPTVATVGKVKVVAKVTSPEAKQTPIEIDLYLNPEVVWPNPSDIVPISSLSAITSMDGIYRLTVDNPSGVPAVSTFSGYLDGDGHTISGLSAPLFTTLNGSAVVRNINFDDVNITSHSGPTGVVAGTATDNARIYNIGVLAGQVGSSGYCGSIVGLLDGRARVINSFSYASITGGTDVGGLVGYNNFKSTRSDLRTMVMNCMYYGEKVVGTRVSPIYGGLMIESYKNLSNYNYFTQSTKLEGTVIYNCALEIEARYINRFEFHRLLLNSNRELAGWYATGKVDKQHTVMAKWVLETADRTITNPKTCPVLKQPGAYPSIINIDAEHAPENAPRNTGGKLGQLTVNIQMGSGALFSAPTNAVINTATSQLTLNITDIDTTHYNYNYRKVQLPYYNQVGTKNYTENRVAAGWKIVSITTDGSVEHYNAFINHGNDATVDNDGNITATPLNYADRYCIDKDLYQVSGRVFNQGGYWDVPEGVTAITIEPYWAKCTYLSDPYEDASFDGSFGGRTDLTPAGIRYSNGYDYTINGNLQKVYTKHTDAIAALACETSATVYDYAVVLVGNYRQISENFGNENLPFTLMSADLDFDNEPDYAHICKNGIRKNINPIRIDFINSIGIGMAQKSNSGKRMSGWGILFPKGWFEITNTTLVRFVEFEADGNNSKAESPVILQGGIYEQFVSMKPSGGAATKTSYLIVGGNAWFAMFNNGSHGNNNSSAYTQHTPVNVLGGDYEQFYLTGYFNTSVTTQPNDNAECYISGGHFGEVAGTGMEGIGGNVVWKIYGADIANFYGGGINVNKPILGNIVVDINKSHVGVFCGGPKCGNMQSGKQVFTTASECTFGTFFGAGYGGTAYNVPRLYDHDPDGNFNYPYNGYIQLHYKREYRSKYNGMAKGASGDVQAAQQGSIDCNGIAVDYEYELFAPPAFDGDKNVCRFRIRYASLSMAVTHNIVSRLTDCTITNNFYGGGNLGLVDGNISSTLKSCTVLGNVYGAGFSAQAPSCPVMPEYPTGQYDPLPYYNQETGAYTKGVKTINGTPSNGILYTWRHTDTPITDGSTVFDEANHYILTNEDMDNLGSITGTATLTITGNSHIGPESGAADAKHGNVYGGGEESAVGGDTRVSILGTTHVKGNVYGGGNLGNVRGSTHVSIGQ